MKDLYLDYIFNNISLYCILIYERYLIVLLILLYEGSLRGSDKKTPIDIKSCDSVSVSKYIKKININKIFLDRSRNYLLIASLFLTFITTM